VATYIINPLSATNGTGSLLDPKNTYEGLTVAPGDTIAQIAGTTHLNVNPVRPSVSGNASNRITYCVAEPLTGALIFDGSQTATIQGAINGNGMDLGSGGSRSYISVHSLTIKGGPSTSATSRVGLQARGGVSDTLRVNRFENLTLTAEGGTGLDALGQDVKILNCTIKNCRYDGIFGTGKDWEIGHCDIFDVDLDGGIGDGIDLDLSADWGFTTVHHNRVRLGYAGTKQGILMQGPPGALGTCLIYANDVEGAGGAAIALGMAGCRAFGNRVSNVDGAGAFSVLRAGCVIAHNVIRQARNVFVFTANGCTGTKIQNNTILLMTRRGVSLVTGVTGNEIEYRNNAIGRIVIPADETSPRSILIEPDNTWVSNNNCWGPDPLPPFGYFGLQYTYDAYRTLTSQDAASTTVDPQITPEGKPLPGSPLLTGGADLGYVRDIRGLQSRKHIGAYGKATTRRIA